MPIALPNPPHPTPPASTPATSRLRKLAGLTALVLGAHWLLLQGVPKAIAAFQLETEKPAAVFTTRTIEAPLPMPVPVRVTPPKPRGPKPPLPQALPPPVVPRPEPPLPEPAAGPDASTAIAQAADDPTASSGGTGNGGVSEATAPAPGKPASAVAPDTAAAASAPAADVQAAYRFVIPAPVRLLYDVNGVVTFAYTGGAEMIWKHDGANYTASLQITKFGFSLRNWTSKGALDAQGVAPIRFGDKGRSSEVAAHFQRDKGIVSFSKNAPEVPLQAGAQDHLSAFFQLSAMLAGDPARFAPETLVPFQAVNAQGSEAWVFKVGALENLDLPGGPAAAIHLTREHSAQYDTKVEVWLAPALAYLPVRIRLSQVNGDFAELVWRSTQKAE